MKLAGKVRVCDKTPTMLDAECWRTKLLCHAPPAYIGPKSRTERPRKTRIDTETAYVTRDLDTTFKVKDQGH